MVFTHVTLIADITDQGVAPCRLKSLNVILHFIWFMVDHCPGLGAEGWCVSVSNVRG